jgi:hypothetical protein
MTSWEATLYSEASFDVVISWDFGTQQSLVVRFEGYQVSNQVGNVQVVIMGAL